MTAIARISHTIGRTDAVDASRHLMNRRNSLFARAGIAALSLLRGYERKYVRRKSPQRPLVRDHLAVVWQRANVDEFHLAAELGHRAQRRDDRLLQRRGRPGAFGHQRHHILLARARDDEAQAAELGMALADLRHLA